MPKRKPCKTVGRLVGAGWLQLYHAKAETTSSPDTADLRKQVATLPCQSGNHYARGLPDTASSALQLYHAKAETSTCRISRGDMNLVATLPCQSGNTCQNPAAWRIASLQLYHAKAETSIELHLPFRQMLVATLPCQSGN